MPRGVYNRAPVRTEPRNLPPEGERKVRKHKGSHSPFHISAERLARYPDLSFEWKRETVLGEPNAVYALELSENAWEVVSDEMAKEFGVLKRHGGMVLMMRPAYLTDEARAEDKQRSHEAVYGRVQDAEAVNQGKGQFERTGQIKRSIMRPAIPE